MRVVAKLAIAAVVGAFVVMAAPSAKAGGYHHGYYYGGPIGFVLGLPFHALHAIGHAFSPHHYYYGHKRHYYGSSYSGRGCHPVQRQEQVGTPYQVTVRGTMCYDYYGRPYIVRGSRYVAG